MTSFSISLSEFFVTVAFMSGKDALRTADGSSPFSGADLEDADLEDADLYGADLRGANLKGADLYGADLRGAKKIAVIYAPGMSSRGDFLYAVAGAGAAILFKAGCFWGSEGDLRAKVIAEKGDSKSARLYLMAISFLAMALSEAE